MTKGELDIAFSGFEPTGNPSADMVAACITFHKNHPETLEKIYLRHDMYQMFHAFISGKGLKPQDNQVFVFDDVDVQESPMDISEPMTVVYRKRKYDTGNYKYSFGKN